MNLLKYLLVAVLCFFLIEPLTASAQYQYTFDNCANIKPSSKVMWDKAELKKGQIGRATILKKTSLYSINSDNKLKLVRYLNPGKVYRIYNYKVDNTTFGSLVGLGGNNYIKRDTNVKYETPSKQKLELVKCTSMPPILKAAVSVNKRETVLYENEKGKIVYVGEDLSNNIVAIRYEGEFKNIPLYPDISPYISFIGKLNTGPVVKFTHTEEKELKVDKDTITVLYDFSGFMDYYISDEDMGWYFSKMELSMEQGFGENKTYDKSFSFSDTNKVVTIPGIRGMDSFQHRIHQVLSDKDKKIVLTDIRTEKNIVYIRGEVTYNHDIAEVPDNNARLLFNGTGMYAKNNLSIPYNFYEGVSKDFVVSFDINPTSSTYNNYIAKFSLFGLGLNINLKTGMAEKVQSEPMFTQDFLDYIHFTGPLGITDVTGTTFYHALVLNSNDDDFHSSNEQEIIINGMFKKFNFTAGISKKVDIENDSPKDTLEFYEVNGREEKLIASYDILPGETKNLSLDVNGIGVLKVVTSGSDEVFIANGQFTN